MTYSHFVLHIKGRMQGKDVAGTSLGIEVMGSDQEPAISKARADVFPNTHVWRDMKLQMNG